MQATQGRKAELLDKVCSAFLPKLHLWQLAKFSEPATWHAARLAFTRTCAVWSMVRPASSKNQARAPSLVMCADLLMTCVVMHGFHVAA